MTSDLRQALDALRAESGGGAHLVKALRTVEEWLERSEFERKTLLETLERASAELEGRVSELSLLRHLSEVLADGVETEEMTVRILAALRDEQGIEDSALWMAEGDELVRKAGLGRGNPESSDEAPLTDVVILGEGLIGQTGTRREGLIVHDGQVEARCRNADPFLRRGSFCLFPLLCSGRLVGVLWLGSSERHAFPAERVRVLSMAAGQIAQGLAGSELFGKMSRFSESLSEVVVSRTRALEEKNIELQRFQTSMRDFSRRLQLGARPDDMQLVPGSERLRQALSSLRALAAASPDFRATLVTTVTLLETFCAEYEGYLEAVSRITVPLVAESAEAEAA